MKIPINKLKIKSSFEKPNSSIFVKIKSLILQGASHKNNMLLNVADEREYEELPTFYIYYND